MHFAVMAAEAIDWLAVRPTGTYLEATAGLGGHTGEIARRLTTGRVIANDRDAESLEMVHSQRTNLKTVRDACELQPNALSIKLSDQIEQLDQLITAEGDGAAFFEKTKITQGMQDLITEGVARLAGASAQAVFHLKQAMGGGKTHLLVGFGLLAKHPELRKAYCGDTLYGSAFGSARTAAFNGRNNPDHFFWGEIAGQLGKGDQFRSFWTSGPKAPDEKDWLKLFDGGEPIL